MNLQIEQIIETYSRISGIPVSVIKGKRRTKRVSDVRQAIMYDS